ncbi:hypothetical protein MRS44_015209 [Fusarium solani]|uniref:uncharacterized protein n=1 Tax=Fusarium solani TaxID=169388 RepID=UPI0032C3DC88|nr:hypothetical protein MRS44_015209 [Fusarium solani]
MYRVAEAIPVARDAPCEADYAPCGVVDVDATDAADTADDGVILGVEVAAAVAVYLNVAFDALSIAYHDHHDLGLGVVGVVSTPVLTTFMILDSGSLLAILALFLPFLRVTATSYYHLVPDFW